ncbi:hypothetical protein [Phocicoccus pinnipedialis]|uniref:HTH merR-type domain-containing protein n=1 Tax=Phocicoccus pinnipedialis TaxID=110845 RepID=A0A6V7R4W9_9BACL|nr:hypothetical protein [Jeotgalicoccus pinnipedialis]MBP1939793.1 biotin operon repressor [Jeotgalicoccus pinnipedialis]CAD2072421.1 hypothetical protein JEOPIN946_00514 [Jeotgalicoccus pinnipedialis]
MSQQNQIYYTTAQVTDMVELSDQNVRKYVRMLEERGYDVAKDEHQRRLFSQNDVSVLNEMIRTSKTPGFTLELAADEIMKNLDEIVSKNEIDTDDNRGTNEDILKVLEKVLVKLDEMRQENIVLRENVSHLVSRLEEYDARILEVGNEQKLISTQMEEIKEQTEPQNEKTQQVTASTETTVEEEKSREIETKSDSSEANTTGDMKGTEESTETAEEEKSETSSNIDMSKYEDPMEAIEVPEDNKETIKTNEDTQTKIPEQTRPVEEPKKKGFFARLFGN